MTDIGATVKILLAFSEDDDHLTGKIVGPSLWINYTTGEPTGERLIEFPDGLRLYYAPWMFRKD
jgi:hypothetical protein